MNLRLNLPQKDLLRHGWIPLAIMLGMLPFLPSSSPAQTYLPSTSDLWDISQGSVVTATSGPHAPYSDIRDMFGGAFSEVAPGETVFDDGRPPGFVHYVEWQTAVPVTVGSFNLFALGDSQFANQREFAQFVLKAKSSPSATNFDLTLYTLVVTNHPYTFVDPVNHALVAANITPVTAQFFRAEFTQYTAGRGFDGPRVIELDGFGPNLPVIVTQPASQSTSAGANVTFAVTASGSAPLNYQWSVNGSTPLAMETNATLVVTNVQPGESGNLYSVQVTNAFGMTNSASATLTVTTPILPSSNDLWDISQGSVVTGTSGPHAPYSDIRDMFGGEFSETEPGDTVFNDGQPPGFVHYVEWQTPVPVIVSSFNLFAGGDGPADNNEREFSQFVLKAKSSPSATNFDLTLYTLVVTNHPYSFLDPVNFALVSTNITPVTAQYFRAEFTQYTAGRGYDGPRIFELDGFGPNPPVINSGPVNIEIFEGADTSFSVVTQGSAPLSYQWQENSTNIPAAVNPTATNATLVLTNLQPAQSGNLYSVVVTNQFGSTNSSNALLTVLTPGSCFTQPAGLVDWWPGEHSGLDIAGTNNGTLVGGVTFAPGEVGQAFNFNGASGYVSIPASASLDVGQGPGLTIEAWIKPADAAMRPVTEWNNGSGGYGVHFWINQPTPFGSGPGSLYANVVDATGQGHSFVSPPGLVVTNVFQHVALTYDRASGVATFYYNGAMVAQQYIGSFALQTSYPFYLGYRPSGDAAGTLFNGEMDEVSLYNNALSAAQIQTIYAVGSAGKCKLPVITSQPQSQVDYYGTSIVLSVNAVGNGTLSYQWLDNGAVIANATNSTLMLNNLQFTNAGAYSVVISDPYGVTASAPAFLNVNPAGVSIALYSGITISGVPGLTYGIQYNTNLNNPNGWLGLTNVTLTDTNALSFDLQPATLSRRYYRVILGPISIP